MFRNFDEIEKKVAGHPQKKLLALACAHDADALAAVIRARRIGALERAALIGRPQEIRSLLEQQQEPPDPYSIIACDDEAHSAQEACAMVARGEAAVCMKGLMQTGAFVRAVLDAKHGLMPENALLSQATVLEYRQQNRLLVISDCAVNIAPDAAGKMKILRGAVALARSLGMEQPRVAMVTPVEELRPKIISTMDAQAVRQAWERGELEDCIVDGPLALDNAVSPEAARHKGIGGPVAGQADVLIMPNLDAGNIFTKSLTYFACLRSVGCVCGPRVPVVMTSRTDTPENKYLSILIALLQAR